jgi:hypothetical protein
MTLASHTLRPLQIALRAEEIQTGLQVDFVYYQMFVLL